jgi:hypothetical protein
MRSPTACCFSAAGIAAAAALVVTAGSSPAAACDYPCGGYGYEAAYHAPPVYAPPVAVYAAPPVYSYSYYGPAYPPAYYSYYTTRVNIFRGPRWNYSAAYYTSPVIHRGGCRHVRVSPCARARAHIRPYRSFYYGPIIHVSRRW